MAVVVDYVDEVARRRMCDVLWFYFDPEYFISLEDEGTQQDRVRSDVIDYLRANNVNWQPTYGIFDGTWHDGDAHHLYLDMPYDPNSALFQKIDKKYCFTENGKELSAVPGVHLCVLTYGAALENEETYSDALDEF